MPKIRGEQAVGLVEVDSAFATPRRRRGRGGGSRLCDVYILDVERPAP
ncbi:MAG: hypothetical protein QXD08_08940 [Pyrobaculum sp.]